MALHKLCTHTFSRMHAKKAYNLAIFESFEYKEEAIKGNLIAISVFGERSLLCQLKMGVIFQINSDL